MTHVAVMGATGFVGSAVCAALKRHGHSVVAVRSPRLRVTAGAAVNLWQTEPQLTGDLAAQLQGADTVICASGMPDASSRDEQALYGANAALPGVLAAAATTAGTSRLVHVSSAVVQGSQIRLDAKPARTASSLYGRSKAAGETAVLHSANRLPTTIYRPPSVHSPDRRITRAIYRIANSPLSSVLAPGNNPTPQAHIDNVGEAIAYLATCTPTPPPIVIHPWEGWTTASFLSLFGHGRDPILLPGGLSPIVRAGLRTGTRFDSLAANVRRLEMLWFGQLQETSWLTQNQWRAPLTETAWVQLVDATAERLRQVRRLR